MTVVPMTEEIGQRTPVQTAIAKVRSDESREQFRAALPATVSVDRFTRATATALLQNPDLAKTDEAALFQAIVKCAQDGLFPDGREAALVIYKGKAQYIPMIAGVRKIAAEYGWTIRTHVAYEHDAKFEVIEGTDQRIDHRPAAPGVDRGKLIAAYAVAHHRDGRCSIVEVMYQADIEKAQAVAKTQTVWNQWPAQMWEKTVGHRIAKKLPLDPVDQKRLSRVIDAAEFAPGEAAHILYGPEASFSEIPSGEHAYVAHELPSGSDARTEESVAEAVTTPSAGDASNSGGGGQDPSGGGSDADPSGASAAAAAPQDEEAVMLAAEAARYVPSSGAYSAPDEDNPDRVPLTLAEILALDGGRSYLTKALMGLPDGEWRSQVEAFARVQMPAEYAAFIAARDSKAA